MQKEPKIRFCGIFSSFGPQVDLILHIMMAKNLSHYGKASCMINQACKIDMIYGPDTAYYNCSKCFLSRNSKSREVSEVEKSRSLRRSQQDTEVEFSTSVEGRILIPG